MDARQANIVSAYRFDDITLDVGRCRVRRGDTTLKLGKLTYELLLFLAEGAPRVVTQNEVAERLWGGRYVNPETIKQRVKLLRQALSDDAGQPRYIEVVRGQGYRLIPDVGTVTDETSSPTWKFPAFAAATIVVIGLAVFLGIFWTAQAPSIAVLPFTDMSPDGDQAYLGDGIAEELLNELSRLDGLDVAGRSSSFSFTKSDEDLRAIGEALGVDSVLGGSIRKDGDVVRVRAWLVDAANGYERWSDTYDGELASIFTIQEEIATAVSGALGVRLGVGGVNAFKGAGTRNVEAYEAYLQGVVSGGRPDDKIRFLERATQLDENYSAAWSQLGLITAATQWRSAPEEGHEIRERAYGFVLRAVELDPQSAEANSLLGTILYSRYDWLGGEVSHRKAISILPDRENLAQYGNLLMRTGRSAAARVQWDAAEADDPSRGRPEYLRVHVALAQKRFAEAREVTEWVTGRRAIPNRLSIALNEGDPEAIKATIRALPPNAISTATLYLPVLSVFDSTKAALATLRAVYADSHSRWPSKLHDIALLAAYFGDPEFALQAIGEELRNSTVRLGAVWYPLMSEVRQLPGFNELVTDLNLVTYWRASGWADLCQPLGEDDFTCR